MNSPNFKTKLNQLDFDNLIFFCLDPSKKPH